MSLTVTPDLEAWRNIPGWTCTRLREWYDEVALFIPDGGTFVEIGVAYGASLSYLIARLIMREEQCSPLDDRVPPCFSAIRTVGVDIWEAFQGQELAPDVWARVSACKDPMTACLSELARSAAYVYGRTTLVRDTGENAAKLFKDGSVDVVFIDEHHTRESVSAAIRAWLPKVKSGGILSGHDCNDHYPGVLQACADLLPSNIEVRPPHPDDNGWGGVWVWRKP